MLINSNDLLEKAVRQGYAIPAYNINNLEWTRYVLEECDINKSPVILGVSTSAVKYFGGYNVVYNVVTSLIKDLKIKVPVVLHLDHAKTKEECFEAIDAGFTSVMIDLSDRPIEENEYVTKEVVCYAKKHDVSVEAELGSLSKEDDNCNINIVKDYVLSTEIDSLAPAIGNKHGIYIGDEKLDFELLGQICKETKIPLVLHGASGLDENKLKTCIFCGVAKININTDLQLVWSKSVRNYLSNNKDVYDPRKIISSGEDAIKKEIMKKNKIFGCNNRFYE